MAGAKKKKGKGKGKKVKKKCIDEKETLAFEQEILDNNRQLARLRSRNEELEEEIVVTKEKFQQLEEDRADIIAHLKRNLKEKGEEAEELSERVSTLEEIRKDELAVYKKKEEAMNQEFKTMQNNLSAEVKLVAGKLNSLEDWRLARLDLMGKFEDQERRMAEQEARHEQALYAAEKSVVVGKALLQKEMKQHLQQLSRRLLKAITLRITDVMNRAIRENVALNRDVDKLLKTNKELFASNIECKEMEQTMRLRNELLEAESNILLKKTLKQRREIYQVADDFKIMLARYGVAEKTNGRLKLFQETMEDIREKNKLLMQEVTRYEKNILAAREKNKELLAEIQHKEQQLDVLKDVLNNASTFINEAVQIAEEAYSNQQCIGCLGPKMLQSLMKILDTDTITGAIDYTASQIDNISCKYTMGCLGLIPPMEEEAEREEIMQTDEEDDSEEEMEGEETLSSKRIPSCLLSVISSSIPSMKE